MAIMPLPSGILPDLSWGSGGLLGGLPSWLQMVEGQRDRPLPADAPRGLPLWMTNLGGTMGPPPQSLPQAFGDNISRGSAGNRGPAVDPYSIDISQHRLAPPPIPFDPAMVAPVSMPVSAPPIAPQGGLGGWLAANSNALIGLGAGIAGGGRNWNEAVGRGLQGFISGRQQDASAQLQNQSKNLTYQTLLARGVPESEARAAMGSPEMLRALTNQYFAPKNRGFQVIGYDGGGKPKYGWVGQTGDVTPYDVPR